MDSTDSSQASLTRHSTPRSAMSGYPFNTYQKIRQENVELICELERSKTENSDLASQLSTQTQTCDDLKDQVQGLTEQLRSEQDQNMHSKGQICALTDIQRRTEEVTKNLNLKIEGMKDLISHSRFRRQVDALGTQTGLDDVTLFIRHLSELIDSGWVGWEVTDDTFINAKESFHRLVEKVDEELGLELMNLFDTVSRIMLERKELVGRIELLEEIAGRSRSGQTEL